MIAHRYLANIIIKSYITPYIRFELVECKGENCINNV